MEVKILRHLTTLDLARALWVQAECLPDLDTVRAHPTLTLRHLHMSHSRHLRERLRHLALHRTRLPHITGAEALLLRPILRRRLLSGSPRPAILQQARDILQLHHPSRLRLPDIVLNRHPSAQHLPATLPRVRPSVRLHQDVSFQY